MTNWPIHDEDFDLYALGALEGDEKQAIEELVRSSAEAARKLEEARGRMALLALAAPSVEPSPGARDRLLHQARATARGGGPLSVEEKLRRGFFRENWWAAILTPATAALALATVFLWIANDRLNRQIEDLRAAMQQQKAQAIHAQAMLDLVTASDTIQVNLAPQPGQPLASGHVLFNARQGMLMYQGNLPAPPSDKSYQLWLVPASGTPISAGVLPLAPGAKGAFIMSAVPAGVAAKAFAVTLEPAGGRPQPTGPKVQVGPVT